MNKRNVIIAAICLIVAGVCAGAVLLRKGNSYYQLGGIYLGMTNAQVLESFPGLTFHRVTIVGDSANRDSFDFLAVHPPPKPWNRLWVCSVDGKVVSISGVMLGVPSVQEQKMVDDTIALYGNASATRRPEGEPSLLVNSWGQVTYKPDDTNMVFPEIHGRAILYRHGSPGASPMICVSNDGQGLCDISYLRGHSFLLSP